MYEIADQLHRSGKKKVWTKTIEGGGHLLEPPYAPLCIECHTPGAGPDPGLKQAMMLYGGDLKYNERNQVEAWNAILDFFHEHLVGTSPLSKL